MMRLFLKYGRRIRSLVSSGSVAVHPDSSVQLLAEEATLVENLDPKVKRNFSEGNKSTNVVVLSFQAAQDALSEAQRRLGSAKDDKQKAEAQIEVECAEAAIKAVSGAFQ